MLNQVAAEALYSATYVENYLDSVDNLPDDVQRFLSRIREIDLQYNGEFRRACVFFRWAHARQKMCGAAIEDINLRGWPIT